MYALNIIIYAKIGHVGSQNLITFQTFVTYNFLLQYGIIATQFSEIVHNLTGFPTPLTEPKYYISVLRYDLSNHMVYIILALITCFRRPSHILCRLNSRVLQLYLAQPVLQLQTPGLVHVPPL